jgi:Circularly permutated YpsA SLOG family
MSGKRRQMKIVSGGQTGVDRAALDFAIRHGYEHGGWCPHGRRAEDGVKVERFRTNFAKQNKQVCVSDAFCHNYDI